MNALAGKTALVTGGGSGIGKAVATGLAKSGARVVILARDAGRGERAAADIRSAAPGAHVEVLLGDLASLKSVRTAAAEFQRRHTSLHILVEAAGVFLPTRTETEDGIETTFATNYLGHFLLAHLLLDTLKKSAPSRVVIVSSRYGNAKVDFDDLMTKKRKFTILNAVPPTKLAQVLFAQELAERLHGTGVVVNAMHPGLVKNTQLLTQVGGMWRFLTNTFGGSAEKGADTALWLATAPETATVTGKMWAGRKPLATPGQGSDPAARKRLWDESLRLAQLA